MRRGFLWLALVLFALLTGSIAAAPVLPLPPRPADAMTGTEFYNLVKSASIATREELVYQQIALGNVPGFIRNLVPIQYSDSGHTVLFYATPDYMAIGSDADFFRMPMSANLAQWVADLADCNLPTRKMVIKIHDAATVRLAPYPFSPSTYDIMSIDVFWASNTQIEIQRTGNALGLLVDGIKKDICVTPQLQQRPAPLRVAIYGWYQLNGSPIQPLSLVHEATYMDYSHGIRLILQDMTIDGEARRVENVLVDATEAPLLSDEGALNRPDYEAPAPPAPPAVLPLSDSFPSTGRELPQWIDRFNDNPVVSFSPAAPDGDGYALLVRDPSGGIDTARIGSGTDTDYFVECDIYCHYRPGLASDGYDREGIFLRDNGNGLFTGQSSGGVPGNCYGMAFQSDTGRLWCFRTVGGVMADLSPIPIYMPSTTWRRMRIEAEGSKLHFYIDGDLVLDATDTTFTHGQFGVGYQEVFTTNSNLIGTYADNFKAGFIPARDGWEIR